MSPLAQRPAQPVKILIAEDSPTQAQRLRHILEQLGYLVEVAANGRLALDAARRFAPALVISDVVMPEMDGYELCRRIKADPALSGIPIILVTTLSDPDDVIRGLECGADNFILKPYDEHFLIGRVQFVLVNREIHRSEQASMGVEIFFNNQKRFITADRLQILNLLLSTYDAAIRRNRELDRSRAELREINEKLEAANKELEAFSYSVSHDLRTPLRAIEGYSRMIEEDYRDLLDKKGRLLFDVVRSSARQMGQLIEDLLGFSRVGHQPLAAAPLEMTPLVREVLAERAGEAPAARVEVADLPAAFGDRALLRQVWTNLIGNAFKYSGKRAEPVIAIGGRAEDAEIVYWVRDNGAGFDMRYYDKLFGVFQRLHGESEFPGTGVGLAIVRRVVTRHGGRVWAEGERDAGATFFFTLPKTISPPA